MESQYLSLIFPIKKVNNHTDMYRYAHAEEEDYISINIWAGTHIFKYSLQKPVFVSGNFVSAFWSPAPCCL